jgi:Flp pilus assembly protein CpaB
MFIDKSKVNETRSNASYVIPTGKVAVSFSFPTIANAVQAGDTVDLMLTLSPTGAPSASTNRPASTTGTEGQPVTQLMLQDVLILQIGSWGAAPSNGQQQPAGGGEITFAVERQDALALKSANEQGSIQLLLRPAGDHKPATTEPVTLQYLNKRFNFNLLPAVGK